MLENMILLAGWQIDLLAFWILLQGALISVVPEEVVVLSLGYLWGQGKIGFPEAMAVTLAGLLPANVIMVAIGEKLARKYSGRQSVQIAADYLRRYGAVFIFVTRFTPLIRGPVYLAVGASRFGAKRFFKTDGMAAILHVSLLLFLGRALSLDGQFNLNVLHRIGWGAGSLLVGMVIFTLFLENRKRMIGKNFS
jgi:membrane protein DedA with SNARE-associated domain